MDAANIKLAALTNAKDQIESGLKENLSELDIKDEELKNFRHAIAEADLEIKHLKMELG